MVPRPLYDGTELRGGCGAAHEPARVTASVRGVAITRATPQPEDGKLAAVAILTCGDKLALQLRDGGTRIYPGYWSLFGGRVERGETPHEGVIREVREELGVELFRVDYVGEFVEAPCVLNAWEGCTCYAFYSDVSRSWTSRRQVEGASCGLFDWGRIRTEMRLTTTPMTLMILDHFFTAGTTVPARGRSSRPEHGA